MGFKKWQILKRAGIKYRIIEKWLSDSDKILDIGCGPAGITYLLKQDKRDVEAIDIINKSAFNAVIPTLFDGRHLPYVDNSFDICLILTVLHHAVDPEALLREAKRVCRGKIIVIEDVYAGKLQLSLTKFTDSIVNLEFRGHPHNNKTYQGWIELFARLNLKVIQSEQRAFLGLFRQEDFLLKA